jgi:hypothetical protein
MNALPQYCLARVLASLCISRALWAQAAAPMGSAELAQARTIAARAVNERLGLTRLRRVRCVSPQVANCPGGLEIVQRVVLLPGSTYHDSLVIPVQFVVAGVVVSSEAMLMFLPGRSDSRADSGAVVLVRRPTGWGVRSIRVSSGRSQASVAAARQFFQWPAEERRRLDSAAAAPGSSRPPPNER